MINNQSNFSETEIKIFDAAKKVFIRKGMDGARMQEIADEAGINKSLLHYYFRTKEKLFQAVFQMVFQSFIPKVMDAFESEIPLKNKIQIFVESYISLLRQNPYIPAFILQESNRNPDFVVQMLTKNVGINKEKLSKVMTKEKIDDVIIDIKVEHLIVNLISMCVFPFIARPIFKAVLFDNNDRDYDYFLEDRIRLIPQFIMQAITNTELKKKKN